MRATHAGSDSHIDVPLHDHTKAAERLCSGTATADAAADAPPRNTMKEVGTTGANGVHGVCAAQGVPAAPPGCLKRESLAPYRCDRHRINCLPRTCVCCCLFTRAKLKVLPPSQPLAFWALCLHAACGKCTECNRSVCTSFGSPLYTGVDVNGINSTCTCVQATLGMQHLKARSCTSPNITVLQLVHCSSRTQL